MCETAQRNLHVNQNLWRVLCACFAFLWMRKKEWYGFCFALYLFSCSFWEGYHTMVGKLVYSAFWWCLTYSKEGSRREATFDSICGSQEIHGRGKHTKTCTFSASCRLWSLVHLYHLGKKHGGKAICNASPLIGHSSTFILRYFSWLVTVLSYARFPSFIVSAKMVFDGLLSLLFWGQLSHHQNLWNHFFLSILNYLINMVNF